EDQVFKADEVENIFVSGVNNRKIGKTIQKGPWRGLPIFMLTLPERMTCPETCHMLAACYGNAMPRAKRILPGPELEKRIRKDIARLAERYPNGFVIRLHILGDFYSEEYAQ